MQNPFHNPFPCNLLCFKCGGEAFEERTITIPQTYRGLTLQVESKAMVCKSCGWHTLGKGQLNALLAATRKAYQQRQETASSAGL
jgi:YgiT-type zinc finger domain-containing protein